MGGPGIRSAVRAVTEAHAGTAGARKGASSTVEGTLELSLPEVMGILLWKKQGTGPEEGLRSTQVDKGRQGQSFRGVWAVANIS